MIDSVLEYIYWLVIVPGPHPKSPILQPSMSSYVFAAVNIILAAIWGEVHTCSKFTFGFSKGSMSDSIDSSCFNFIAGTCLSVLRWYQDPDDTVQEFYFLRIVWSSQKRKKLDDTMCKSVYTATVRRRCCKSLHFLCSNRRIVAWTTPTYLSPIHLHIFTSMILKCDWFQLPLVGSGWPYAIRAAVNRWKSET